MTCDKMVTVVAPVSLEFTAFILHRSFLNQISELYNLYLAIALRKSNVCYFPHPRFFNP